MKKNPLEWTVFALSLAIILAALGLLGFDMLRQRGDKPEIHMELGRPERMGPYFRVPVRAVNRGSQTAEGLVVEVTLGKADGTEEKAEFEIQFLPRESVRRGWVTFETDPAEGTLEARPVGFEDP